MCLESLRSHIRLSSLGTNRAPRESPAVVSCRTPFFSYVTIANAFPPIESGEKRHVTLHDCCATLPLSRCPDGPPLILAGTRVALPSLKAHGTGVSLSVFSSIRIVAHPSERASTLRILCRLAHPHPFALRAKAMSSNAAPALRLIVSATCAGRVSH